MCWLYTLGSSRNKKKKVCLIDKIRSFDIDESCLEIADTINLNEKKRLAIHPQNIMDIDYARPLGKLEQS